MSDIKNRDYILEAIDQLRRRKARPDINRICNFMTRRFAIDSKDTKADLQRCVENDIVLKVEYKGNISYRNAARKSYGHHIKKAPSTFEDDHKLFPSIVTTAVADLFLEDSDYLDFGVPHAELVKKILTKYGLKFTKRMVVDLLQKEVENGGLIKRSNGNFSLGPTKQNDLEKTDCENSLLSTASDQESTPQKVKKKPGPKPGKRKNEMEKLRDVEACSSGIRMGGRRKRAKKVFDPSDNNLPRLNRKRGRPLGSLNKSTIEKQLLTSRQHGSSTGSTTGDPGNESRPTSRASSAGGSPKDNNFGGVCFVCHLQGKKSISDKMISCRDCSIKAHMSCLTNTDDEMLKMYPDNTWRCPHCKTCITCYETSDAGPLTVCSICADAYHALCHVPKIEKIKNIKFICSNCRTCPVFDCLQPKIEVKEEPETKEDKTLITISPGNSSISSPNSGNSSPYLRSPVPSPTPPTLSPQANNHNNSIRDSLTSIIGSGEVRSISSNDNYRYFNPMNMSDSQSLKDFDAMDDYDPSIPDASNWTFDEVYEYFVQFFPEEAIVFKEQEIDGHSLLLMKRVDVLTSLNLKLGPALKIYKHVIKLQARRDDYKFYWL